MTPIYPDLKDASVYITGGGSGIGAALTDGFLGQGAKVAFIGRSDATAFCDEMEAKHLFLYPWTGDPYDEARPAASVLRRLARNPDMSPFDAWRIESRTRREE